MKLNIETLDLQELSHEELISVDGGDTSELTQAIVYGFNYALGAIKAALENTAKVLKDAKSSAPEIPHLRR